MVHVSGVSWAMKPNYPNKYINFDAKETDIHNWLKISAVILTLTAIQGCALPTVRRNSVHETPISTTIDAEINRLMNHKDVKKNGGCGY